MEGGFLTMVASLFAKILEMGTSFATWLIATEPVNYFVALGLVIAIISIVRSIVRR